MFQYGGFSVCSWFTRYRVDSAVFTVRSASELTRCFHSYTIFRFGVWLRTKLLFTRYWMFCRRIVTPERHAIPLTHEGFQLCSLSKAPVAEKRLSPVIHTHTWINVMSMEIIFICSCTELTRLHSRTLCCLVYLSLTSTDPTQPATRAAVWLLKCDVKA